MRSPGAGGLTLRAMLPNAITAAALCSGLTGIRFAIEGQWAFAIGLVVLVGGLLLHGQDGKMSTYIALVLVAATAEWLLQRGWAAK